MARNRDWDFGETRERRDFPSKMILTLLYGFLMAFVGGYTAYSLFSSAADRAVVETASTQVIEIKNTSDLVVAAVEKTQNSVVAVVNHQNHPEVNDRETIFNEASGSGIIYEIIGNKARIVTNFHVIEGAEAVEIVTTNGERVQTRILGSDPLMDIAVLEINANKVKNYASLGNSDAVKVGETVIAIGNPLGLSFSETVTVGVVSGKNRKLPTYLDEDNAYDWEIEVIQTDAAINFGNSGGALVNLKGEVIGINSAKIVERGVENIGFSIPIQLVKPIMEEIVAYGKVRRAYLGIIPVDLAVISEERRKAMQLPESVTSGVLLLEKPVGPAKEAGLLQNDVIIEIDGVEITSQLILRKTLYNKVIGESVEVVFYRDGVLKKVNIILGELP